MNTLNPSRKPAAHTCGSYFIALFLLADLLAMRETQAAGLAATNTPAAIPWSQIGAKAGAGYKGDGLAVTRNGERARLHCVFQHLDGEATPEGLWLTSTAANAVNDRFRVVAVEVGRQAGRAERGAPERQSAEAPKPLNAICSAAARLPDTGTVAIDAQTARFTRPGLVEEYSVSMDGVRQDFLVPERPAGAGELAVRLAVSGARVEPAADGARLVLDGSERKLAYSRLRVTDATGRELAARVEVESKSESSRPKAEKRQGLHTSAVASSEMSDSALVVVVNDAAAVYPVRIDPTFSDANWISMGGISGTNSVFYTAVYAAAVDSAGNVYIGGTFTAAGDTIANHIAKWDGSSWSALGSGISVTADFDAVYALAVSGTNVYAGGLFSTAGGIAANNIAQWNGSSWSALGSGIDGEVLALAVSGGTVFAGGGFTTAGGIPANSIAKWDGTNWGALGSGIVGGVYALAVSGSTLYAGGYFTTAGGIPANNIAQWNGSSWSALGSGISGGHDDGEGGIDPPYVNALAVSGGTLYVGGFFAAAGDIVANNIVQWNGSSWSALGSGMGGDVLALAVSGGTLYVGGYFASVGDIVANSMVQWNGSSWSALGSGISGGNNEFGPIVNALAVSGTGSDLYVGGDFYTAGDKVSVGMARAILRLPSLALRQTNSSTVAVSWPSPSPGFVLQQDSDGLGSGNWSNVTDSILDDGTNKMITQPMGTSRFFRLVLP